ncbi:putative F-box protein-like isoform X2 [Capsicum annuum]|uniref:F-box protein PP2-B10 n=1 Tax=Capsicum annuum TaxID=4072 RepID=UPI001FB0E050|nr:F-box protein PP2-B10 [Capsicum annuum]KAF3668702.1 putative F-box protein-like isoform X2 [Capsicum annuum]
MNSLIVLPEGCISEIISFTTPADAIRSSVISRGFKSAAESDIVWDKFLPSDHQQIVSRSVAPVVFDSKKDLYFRLSESPILLDEGKLGFWLDKTNGKKCYLLSARQLTISFSDNQFSWEHTFDADSRFPEVAFLNNVDLLDIRGRIGTRVLSSRTNYAAYLVFKVSERYHGLESTKARVRFVNQESEYEAVDRATTVILAARMPRNLKGRLPEKRTDGWLEVEIGKFYNGESGDDNGDVEARLLDSRPFHAKCGLMIEGVEFRPI